MLANVLLRTEDAGLKLTATNLEIGITYWVPGKIDTDGALTVPARLITDVVGGLPSGERVDLEVEGTTLRIKAGRYQTHLRGIEADEFPVIPSPGERPTTRVSQKELRAALSEVVFAAATDEARPILTGVLTRASSGDRLTLAAADNYRIAVKHLPILDPVEDTSLVVPARSYTGADARPGRHRRPGRHHARAAPRARCSSTSRASTSSAGSSTASSPTTSRCCRRPTRRAPSSSATSCSRRCASRRSSRARPPTSSGCKLGDEGTGTITIAAAADVGEAQTEVEAALEGDPVTIAFNARYLQEALQNLDDRPAGARVHRAAVAGRDQADRRRRLRPRDHAGAHAVLNRAPLLVAR